MLVRGWVCGISVCIALSFAGRPLRAQEEPPREEVPAPKPTPVLPPSTTTPVRAMLGVRAAEVSNSAILNYGLTVRQGALITALLRGSPAEQRGLPLGGVIVAVNGARIDSPGDLQRAIQFARPGQTIEVRYFDRAQLYRKNIVMAPYPVGADAGEFSFDESTPGSQTDDDTLPPEPPPEAIDDLFKTVNDLQTQVEQLRQEVATLRKMIEQLIQRDNK